MKRGDRKICRHRDLERDESNEAHIETKTEKDIYRYRDENETVARYKNEKNIETETETEAEKGNRDRNSVFQ